MVATTKAEEEPIFVFPTCKLGSNFLLCGVGEWYLIEPLYIEICHHTLLHCWTEKSIAWESRACILLI